jgi:hypothetical protein
MSELVLQVEPPFDNFMTTFRSINPAGTRPYRGASIYVDDDNFDAGVALPPSELAGRRDVRERMLSALLATDPEHVRATLPSIIPTPSNSHQCFSFAATTILVFTTLLTHCD